MEFTFSSKVDVWGEGAGWHFVRLPKDTYDDIKEASSSFGPRRGFGAVKVQATINTSAWQTSVFPDSKDKSYILFIKKAIRTAEKISAGDTMEVKAKLI